MTLLMLLEMAAAAFGSRLALGQRGAGITFEQLLDRARAGATVLRESGAEHLVYLGPSDEALPVALFAAAWAGVPLIPLNYRLSDPQLRSLLDGHDAIVAIDADHSPQRLEGLCLQVLSSHEWNEMCARTIDAEPCDVDGDDVSTLLYTSGTTAEPKAVVLRHRHLVSYVIGSVEFGGADEADAALVSVPPYHIAGVSTILSNVYAGRRIVYLPSFSPTAWLDLVESEHITNAMVVPTMLARIVDELDGRSAETSTLRTLSYGGARTPVTVLERALTAFEGTDFVNAYGLTETSSTIAVLGPDDHRGALASDDPQARRRLASAGRLIPGIEVEVRDELGEPVAAGTLGEIFVRGEQVSGEYLGAAASLDAEGWFATRDRGSIDDEGYLFIEGRADDTIIRGGENIAPAEIEEVLLAHPDVHQAAAVGVPDEEWGQRIAAAVVVRPSTEVSADDLRAWCRERLRSSKTPDLIVFRDDLPVTETGKLLRREVFADIVDG